MTRVKICGLAREEDLRLALEIGADAVGFIREPSSPRFVTDEAAAALLQAAGSVDTVCVFGQSAPSGPAGSFDQALTFGGTRPAKRIQVVRLRGPLTDAELRELCQGKDAVLLDAFVPGAFGGTGHAVDWELAASIVETSPIPVILAGGLTPENVKEAIRRVRPYMVDVSSGVESAPGTKDPDKLRRFIENAKSA